ncbi:chorismate mutase [Rhodococcus zopfii]|uniref:Chorismate mutase n=1 Tax=Rhodococcus zopfii TaxID=43772 RepID=A0ABU3WMP4_9NOCA|nr:chorismate mutase [Rhodococcus zopfii]MDV2475277.1 chorismate mutase [Rhodococcus zopfii]
MTAIIEPGVAELDVHRLYDEMDRLDADILAAVLQRTELARRIATARVDAGSPRVTHAHDLDVIRRYTAELGGSGTALAMSLLRLR